MPPLNSPRKCPNDLITTQPFLSIPVSVTLYWKEMTKKKKRVEKVPYSYLIRFIPVNFGTTDHWKTLWVLFSLMVFELGELLNWIMWLCTHKLPCTYAIGNRTTRYLRRMLLAASGNNNMLLKTLSYRTYQSHVYLHFVHESLKTTSFYWTYILCFKRQRHQFQGKLLKLFILTLWNLSELSWWPLREEFLCVYSCPDAI